MGQTKNNERKTLEQLAEEVRKRGNRLEVMNGKVYEVSRRLICECDNDKEQGKNEIKR